MDFATFVSLPDLDKLAISEHKVAQEVESETWVATGAGSYYMSFTGGEVVAVDENGTAYVETFSVAACDATASTFYYDLVNLRLYLHTSGNDSPATAVGLVSKYCLMAFFWIGIVNRNESDNPVIYERLDELLSDGNFELWPSALDPDSKYWDILEAGTSTASKDSTVTYDTKSAYSLKLIVAAGGAKAGARQLVITRPNYTHTIKIKYKMNGAGDTASWRIYDSGTNIYLTSSGTWQAGAVSIQLPVSTTWTEYSFTFVTHASYSSYYYEVKSEDPNAIVWLDYASFLRHRYPLYYLPYLNAESIPSIYHGVGDYYDAADKLSFGTLSMINDGWWYTAKATYNWHNKDAIIKIGAVGSDYEDLETVFVGRSSVPKVSDQQASIDIRDVRQSDLVKIPTDRFDTATYPNLGPNVEGTVIPILFGTKTNISPPYIDTVNFKFKVSQTVFGGVTYNMEAISAVYKAGVALATPADYSVNLATGEIDLVADPGSDAITCDAQGLEIDFETAATFTERGADIAFFVLTVLNTVPDTKIDVASLLDYKAGRTQKIGAWLNAETDSLEFLRGLRRSTIVQIYPLLDGTYVFKRYVAGFTSATPRFYTEDYSPVFELIEDTGTAFKYVVVNYDQDPTTGDWKSKSGSTATAEYAHDIRETLPINTYLTNGTEAENIRDFYLPLVGAPLKKLTTLLPTSALKLNPAENAIFSKTITDAEGNAVVVMDTEVYRILEFNKNISTGQATIVALEDLQSAGEVLCEDCYACQVCVTQQAGACSSCFTCELCVSGQCSVCQVCDACEDCFTCQNAECTACEACDACQVCNIQQIASGCFTCVTCEVCNGGCQACDACELCDTMQ